MKKTIKMIAICATLGLSVAPFASVIDVQAQTPAPAAAQGPCTDESKAAWYADFTKFRTTDAAKAYDAAKKYLAACPTEEGQIPAYLKKWVAAYDKEARKLKFQPLLYGEKKYPEALTIGKEMLAEDPENLRLLIDLGYGSYLAAATLKQESYNPDALNYSRKAIQLIESGKAPESWAPFKGKDDTLAYLHNLVGRLSLKDNPSAALGSLIKAAHFDTDLKKDPWTYFFIAAAYEAGPYAKLSAEYKEKFEKKDETPESKLALENINQVIDRMIDAYARAVALAGTDAKYQANKKDWMDGLSTWYKYRHSGQETGLPEMIASVLSKPLPPEPTPLTTLPTTPAAPSTGASTTAAPGGSASPATSKAAGSAAGTSLTTPAKTTTTAAGETATTVKVPAKPKTRNNHRRN
jgi:tetratricopeptide (TPR) repeat protein